MIEIGIRCEATIPVEGPVSAETVAKGLADLAAYGIPATARLKIEQRSPDPNIFPPQASTTEIQAEWTEWRKPSTQ